MRVEDFQVKIGNNIVLEHPIINAAGTCKNLGEIGDVDSIRAFANSSIAALMIGTVTIGFRDGNRGKDFYWENGFTLNSSGMPNPGLKYYQGNWPLIEQCCKEALNGPKPIFVSVFGFELEEFVEMVRFFRGKVALVELNLSCPNIGKRVICYNPDNVSNILETLNMFFGEEVNFAVKLAPFVDGWLLERVVKVIADCPIVRAITTCNSFPGAYDCDSDGRPVICTSNNDNKYNFLGGMSGTALMPIALGQIVQIKKILSDIGSEIKIIGVGGIKTGLDVWKFLKTGASAVQIGSAFLEKPNVKIFDRILSEFIDVSENFEIKNSPYQS